MHTSRIGLVMALCGALGCSGKIADRTVLEADAELPSGGVSSGQGGAAGTGVASGGIAGRGGSKMGPPPDESCDPALPNPSPLLTLSSWEYRRSVAALTGNSVMRALPPDPLLAPPFAVSMLMSGATLSELFAEAELQGDMGALALLPCDAALGVDADCASRFVDDFVGRAFRRPLTDVERDRYVGLFKVASGAQGPDVGVALVVQAALLSPMFLHKIYWGSPDGNLTAFEVAAKLSFLLSGAPPDAELGQAAQEGALQTPEQIATQAERLMTQPQYRQSAQHFHSQWFGLDALANVEAEGLTPSLRAAMRTEAELFIDHLFSQPMPRLSDLLLSHTGFVDVELAQHYGVMPPAAAFAQVELDPSIRFGVLTQAATMTRFNNPTQRGLLVRDRLLCAPVPPPPPDIPTDIEVSPGQTRRSAWEQHRTDPACAGCHRLMDPIGFGFEQFDEIGRHRTTDNGLPIDMSGELVEAGEGLDGPFASVNDLAERLSTSPVVHECLVKTWWAYANQRPVVEADACAIERILSDFSVPGVNFNFNALLGSLVSSQRFRSRDPHQVPGVPAPSGASGSAQTLPERRKLVLDFTLAELQWLRQVVPFEDVPLVEQHLTAVRELEMQLSQLPN